MRGGKRIGAGRKTSEYKTKNVTFRIKVEWENEIKETVRKKIRHLREMT